ncbi:MAG: hypothetical protein QM767_07080, partial [Anaeromyxobacter sp.]
MRGTAGGAVTGGLGRAAAGEHLAGIRSRGQARRACSGTGGLWAAHRAGLGQAALQGPALSRRALEARALVAPDEQ